MAFMYMPIQLFSEESFQQCIVVPFPDGGKIVDTVLVDKTVFLLVEAHPSARITTAHFHLVPALQPIYADMHEYISTVKIDNFRDSPLVIYTIIRIIAGDYGIHSLEYRSMQQQGSDKTEPTTDTSTDSELRKLWDFDIGEDGKNDTSN